MNRFDRLAAILIQLQAKRVVSGPALAEQFGVSLRTVYRDLRSLETAGVPLLAEHAVGYSLVEGYRLPPVLFTREEATALLTAYLRGRKPPPCSRPKSWPPASPTVPRLASPARQWTSCEPCCGAPTRPPRNSRAPHSGTRAARPASRFGHLSAANYGHRGAARGAPALPSGRHGRSNGSRAEDAFDVVVPGLQGFGFSAPLPPTGPFADLTASRLQHLMTTTLGYASYGVHGSNVGTLVTECLALNYAPSLSGIHMTGVPFTLLFVPPADPSAAEQDYLTSSRQYLAQRAAYVTLQAQEPNTLAPGLRDSPAGLAAWLADNFRA